MGILPGVIALAVLLCAWAWAVFVLQPFGHRQWTLITVLALLAPIIAGIGRRRRLAAETPTRLERILGRSLWLGWSVLAGALAGWLGLIGWSAMSPGGAIPPAKSNPRAIRVLTWNILHGTERGMPWTRYGWPIRKKAIAMALAGTRPDILCVQEALDDQVMYLAGRLPEHRRVGVGRDDGRSSGEHCAIFFDRRGLRNSAAARSGWKSLPIFLLAPGYVWARSVSVRGPGSATGRPVAPSASTTSTNT